MADAFQFDIDDEPFFAAWLKLLGLTWIGRLIDAHR
jgi:hypothetical protein